MTKSRTEKILIKIHAENGLNRMDLTENPDRFKLSESELEIQDHELTKMVRTVFQYLPRVKREKVIKPVTDLS